MPRLNTSRAIWSKLRTISELPTKPSGGNLPLSIPGILRGATFAFVLSLGDFLAPFAGWTSGIMISNIVVSLFGAAYNWRWGRRFRSACWSLLWRFFSSLSAWKRNGFLMNAQQ